MNLPRVYISVLNWKATTQTLACLASLQQLTYAPVEIIVVDTNSVDDSAERIQHAFPDVTLIVSGENLGYAGGNELALKYAQSVDDGTGLFWILNNDAEVLPDTLTALVRAYQQYGAALYGSVCVASGTDPVGWQVSMPVWEHNRFRQVQGVPYRERYASTRPRFAEALTGSSLLVPLAVVAQHGFIDTSFFLYCEDVDYCFRLRRNGIQTIEAPESVIIHEGGASHKAHNRNTLQPIITYYRARNKIVLWRRYFGTLGYIKAVATQAIYVVGWLALTVNRGAVGPRSAYFTLMGIRDGIIGRMGKVYAPENYLNR